MLFPVYTVRMIVVDGATVDQCSYIGLNYRPAILSLYGSVILREIVSCLRFYSSGEANKMFALA